MIFFTEETSLIILCALIFFRILTYCAFFLLRKRIQQKWLSRKRTLLPCLAISLCGFLLLSGAFPAAAEVHQLVGSALFGITQGIIGLVWLSSLASFSYRSSYLYILGSHGVATILCGVLLLMPVIFFLPYTILFHVLSFICALLLPRKKLHPTSSIDVRNTVPSLWPGIATVSLFALLSGFVTSLSGTNVVEPLDVQWFTLAISSGVLAIMVVPALLFKQPLKLESSYKIALPLSALGFIILPGIPQIIPHEFAGTLTTTGYMVTGIVLYCTIAELAQTAKTAPMPLFALGDCIPLSFLLVGSIAGAFLAYSLDAQSANIAFVILGIVYLASLTLPILIRKLEPISEPAESSSLTNELTASPTFYTLSEQEISILEQLLKGRTIPRIAQDAYLSTSAVKYHTQKIYRTFNVHSRNELLALFEPIGQRNKREDEAIDLLAHEYELTSREKEVLSYLVQGAPIEHTSHQLDISPNTTKTHVKRIYSKFDVHSKQDLVDIYRHKLSNQETSSER